MLHRRSIPCPQRRAVAYNQTVRPGSIPLGHFFGVDLRVHLYTVVLLPLLAMLAAVQDVSAGRGVLLFLLLMLAILVRESALSLGRLAAGVPVDRLVITPIGAVVNDGAAVAEEQAPRWLALVGPLANFAAAIVMAMLAFSVTSGVNFFQRHLAEPQHLLRAAIWLQIMLGALHLLPATPLDAGALLRTQFVRMRGKARGVRSAAGLSQAIGLGLMVFGGVTQEIVLMLLGGTVLLLAQLEAQRAVTQTAVSSITVGDVMLSEWTSLSASDTVQDALERSAHSLQESFPVVRGPVVVGSITREALLGQLRAEGNGYVQGSMSRDLVIAAPSDGLVATVQRLAGRSARGNVVPVMRDGQVVGMVTPQSLSPAMLSLGRVRRYQRGAEQRKRPQ
jgi:predicted transcriptional regulator